MLLYNGKIYTQDQNRPWADSIILDGGTILATGDRTDLLDRYGKSHESYDLEKRVVLPGLVDSHLHLELYSAFCTQVDCETASLSACISRIKDKANQTKPGQWILGHGWNHNLWPEGIGSKADLDAVTAGHPAYFTSKSVHSGWANSVALELAGITAGTPDPAGGVIVRDSHGEPTGILLENAMLLVERVIPAPTLTELENSIEKAQIRLASFGITGVHDFDSSQCFAALQSLRAADRLKIRVRKGIPREQLEDACRMGLHTGFGDDMLHLGSLKLFADGALGPQTAAMVDPYQGSDSRGMALLTADDIFKVGKKAVDHHISIATHAIGDQANRHVVNGYAKLRQYEVEHHLPHLRHRVEHVQIIQPADRALMKSADIIASMQPSHVLSDWETADKYWGDRVQNSYAWKSITDQGIHLAFGSDAPVESPNPWLGIYAAVTRKPDGCPNASGWNGQERLSLSKAIAGFTTGAAYAAGMENRAGRLKPGFLADLVVLDTDPFSIPADELRTVPTFATMVAGQWVWKAD
jgi:predicted amidohydrolase YtcJ